MCHLNGLFFVDPPRYFFNRVRPNVVRTYFSNKSLLILLGLIVLAVGLSELMILLLEQLVASGALSFRMVLNIQGIVFLVAGLVFYRVVKKHLPATSFIEDQLSEREIQVLKEILSGKSNREIEKELFIEKSTLKSHINRIYKKLGVSTREELMQRFS